MTQDELKQFEKLYEKYKFGADNNHTMDLAYYYNEFVNAIPSLLTHITAQATKIEELEKEVILHKSNTESFMGVSETLRIKKESLESENAELKEKIEELKNEVKFEKGQVEAGLFIGKQLKSENARLRDKLKEITETGCGQVQTKLGGTEFEDCELCEEKNDIAQSAIKGETE